MKSRTDFGARAGFAGVLAGALLSFQCGSDDDGGGTGGNQTGGTGATGSGATGGSVATGGSGGSGASGGSAGAGASAGTGGMAGGSGGGGNGGTNSGGNGGSSGSGSTGGTSTGGTSGSGAAGGSGGTGGAGTSTPTGVSGTWKLVWADEFEGSKVDLTKWRPNWFGSTDTALTKPPNDLEASCYDPAQVTVTNGALELTAVATSKSGCVKKDGSKAAYASGLVMSDGRYNFTYGFVEARMWLPPGTGTPENWAAFWVNGKVWPEDGEIDIMETLGGGGSTRWTYHYDSDTTAGVSHKQITGTPSNMISGSGWHVFGANWQPDKITFYYDGKDVGGVTSAGLAGGAKTASSPHYFILNHGLNGSYPIKVPSTLKIDYVRHWQ